MELVPTPQRRELTEDEESAVREAAQEALLGTAEERLRIAGKAAGQALSLLRRLQAEPEDSDLRDAVLPRLIVLAGIGWCAENEDLTLQKLKEQLTGAWW